jgi:hypothetical protein
MTPMTKKPETRYEMKLGLTLADTDNQHAAHSRAAHS